MANEEETIEQGINAAKAYADQSEEQQLEQLSSSLTSSTANENEAESTQES